MTKYREIIRLKSLNFSERNIALSYSVSRNTVSKFCKKAEEQKFIWPIDESMTDAVLEKLLFPKDKSAMNKRMPDYAYIRKELLRNGVSKELLWTEYCEDCRMAGEEPLMYSQFCYYIQKDEEKRRATTQGRLLSEKYVSYDVYLSSLFCNVSLNNSNRFLVVSKSILWFSSDISSHAVSLLSVSEVEFSICDSRYCI